jgi:hypothetical protein
LVDINIEDAIAASLRGAVENYLQTADLNQIIADTLQKQINNVVLNLTGKVYNDLISKRDLTNEVSQLIQGILRDQLLDVGTKKITELLQEPEMNRTITTSVQNEVHRVAGSYNFPPSSIPFSSIKMDGSEFNAAWINNGIYKNFVSTGITDSASKTQLQITDEGIITTNNISADNLLIENSTFLNNLSIEGELTISGTVGKSTSLDQYITSIANDVSLKNINNSNNTDIDLSNRNITNGNVPILSRDSLGPSIVNSNLRKLGNLIELEVAGQALIGDTLLVNSGKVGINALETAGVLSIWDQDSELSVVKYAQKNMFVGSTRQNDITIGSNNQNQIGLKLDGTIELNGPIRFGGLLINIVDSIPEQVGEPGEIAIMRDGSAIYRCQGQTTWGKIL